MIGQDDAVRLAAAMLSAASLLGACAADEDAQMLSSTTIPLDPSVTYSSAGLRDPRCNPAANLLKDPTLRLGMVLEGESLGSFGPDVELPEITDESVVCLFSNSDGTDITRDVLVTGSTATEIFLPSAEDFFTDP